MAGQSKVARMRLYSGLAWTLFKQKYATVPALGLAAFVGACGVTLARGMRRDRQSITAAVTRELLQQQQDEKAKKSGVTRSTFVQRITAILAICIPGWQSKEAWFLTQLSVLLIARTVFSIILSEKIGKNVMFLVERNWLLALDGVLAFVLLSFPASFINT